MDALDLRLVRAIGTRPFSQTPRTPQALRPTHLAKRLGVHRNVVGERLRRLERWGVIAAYQIYPNLHHLGLHWTTLLVEAPDDATKAEALRRLGLLDGFGRFLEFVGPHVCLDLYYRDPQERERRLRIVNDLVGPQRLKTVESRDHPAVDEPLTLLDWKIVRALRGRARRPLPEVAKELRVTPRTVERRLQALFKRSAVDVALALDPSKIPDAIPLGFLVHRTPTSPAPAEKVVACLQDRYFYADAISADPAARFAVSAFATSTSEIDTFRHRILDVPGVAGVDVFVHEAVAESEAWLDEEIERRTADARAPDAGWVCVRF